MRKIFLLVFLLPLCAAGQELSKAEKRFKKKGIPARELCNISGASYFTSHADSGKFYRIYTSRAKVVADSVNKIKEYVHSFLIYRNGKMGIIRLSENGPANFVPPVFDTVRLSGSCNYKGSWMESGHVIVKQNKAWGIYYAGRQIAPCIYDSISGNSREIAQQYFFVTKNGKKGLLSPTGKIIADTIYSEIEISSASGYETDFAAAKNKDGYRVINARNGKSSGNVYDSVLMSFNNWDWIIPVSRNGGWTLLDRNCRELLKPVYESPKEALDHFGPNKK